MELKGKKINFLGDSITEGCRVEQYENIYWNRIGRDEGAIVRGYGVGGTRIARQWVPSEDRQKDRDFVSRGREMDDDADIVVVFGGTNDFGQGDAPLGTMVDRTQDTFYGALHTLFTMLIEKYPAATIVMMTPLHRCCEDNLRGDGCKALNVAPLKTYVEIIREVAEYYAVPVLDLFATGGMQPKVPIIKERYMPDGLHPNDAGHAILAKKLAAFLKSI